MLFVIRLQEIGEHKFNEMLVALGHAENYKDAQTSEYIEIEFYPSSSATNQLANHNFTVASNTSSLQKLY